MNEDLRVDSAELGEQIGGPPGQRSVSPSMYLNQSFDFQVEPELYPS